MIHSEADSRVTAKGVLELAGPQSGDLKGGDGRQNLLLCKRSSRFALHQATRHVLQSPGAVVLLRSSVPDLKMTFLNFPHMVPPKIKELLLARNKMTFVFGQFRPVKFRD